MKVSFYIHPTTQMPFICKTKLEMILPWSSYWGYRIKINMIICREKELAKVTIKKEDLELIVSKG